MLETLKFSSVITSLSSAAGWLDLSLTLFCVAVALIFSRYWCRYSGLIQEKTDGALLLRQALTRIVFPASAFVFILLTRSLFHLYAEPLFLNIALPLTIAFLVIRLMAYTLRSLFPRSMWLTASERAIAFSVWSLVALHFMGVLPEIIEELDSLVLPFGKGVSVWALLKGIIVVSFTASVAIWFSDLIEQRVLSQELGKNASYGGWLFFVRFIRVMLLFIAVMLALQGIGMARRRVRGIRWRDRCRHWFGVAEDCRELYRWICHFGGAFGQYRRYGDCRKPIRDRQASCRTLYCGAKSGRCGCADSE